MAETTIPAGRANISTIASLHAVVALDLLTGTAENWTSLLLPLARVPGVFDTPFRATRVAVPKQLTCLICSAVPVRLSGEALDVALDQALGRLAHE